MVCVFASCCYVWLCKNNVWGVCAGAEVSEAKRRRTVSDASEGSVEICKYHIGVFVYITTKLMKVTPLMNSAGAFTLPFASLNEPSPTLQVRDVKDWYVEYLADMLAEDDQEELASPLLVIASVTKLEFRPERLGAYFYEVSSLGMPT